MLDLWFDLQFTYFYFIFSNIWTDFIFGEFAVARKLI